LQQLSEKTGWLGLTAALKIRFDAHSSYYLLNCLQQQSSSPHVIKYT